MPKGWISIHRQIQEHWLWKDKPFSKGQAWVDLLLSANHDDSKFPFGAELIEVKRGEFVTSEIKLMERWGWSKSKVRHYLFSLETDSMIVKKVDRKKTIISIVNYGAWQDMQTTKRPQKDHKKTTERPLEDTINNDNNDNNVNKSISNMNVFTPPPIESVIDYCREREKGVDAQKWFDFYSAKGWMIGKNKMKDWKAAVRTWESGGSLKCQTSNKPTSNKYDNFEL